MFSLEDQIKEEKNTLTEKEIYLLQQLAKKSSSILKKIIILTLLLLYQSDTFSNDMILDQLKNPKITNQSQKWNFITDQVMGGVSTENLWLRQLMEFYVIE